MDFSEVIKNRRSIRAFADKPVEQQVIDEILSEALESPSSSNTQPYKLAVATGQTCQVLGQKLLDKYNRSMKIQKKPMPIKAISAMLNNVVPDGDYKPIMGKYPGIFQERRVQTGIGLYEMLGIERSDRKARDEQMSRNFIFFDAPVAIFAFIHPGMTHTALVDLGIMLQSLMLSATSKGLGTCAQGALGIWRSPIDEHFDVPKDYKLVCGVALGYPQQAKVNEYRPSKLSLDDLLIPTRPEKN